jgi:hypothetical protein
MAKKMNTIKNYEKYIHPFHYKRRAFAEHLKVTIVPRKQCKYHYSSDPALGSTTTGSVSLLAGAKYFSFFQNVHIGCGPASSLSTGSGCAFPWDKVTDAGS